MARQRSTFGKLQRAADKQAKAKEKQERRAARADEAAEETDENPAPVADQQAVLQALADIHTAFEERRISADDFEKQRELLTGQLVVD